MPRVRPGLIEVGSTAVLSLLLRLRSKQCVPDLLMRPSLQTL